MGTLQEEVAAEASPLLRLLIDHARAIAVLLVLCLLALAGYWLYEERRAGVRDELRLEFGRLVTSRQGRDRLAALEDYLKTAPEELRPAALFALAESAAEVRDPVRAYAAWERIARLDPPLRTPALLAMASALAEQGKKREALDLLASAAGLPGPDQSLVNERIILLAEALEQYDRAIMACEAVAAAAPPFADASFWERKLAALRQKAALAAPASPQEQSP
jgi:tetratricopeptide (TPR) repeat protein